jgi:hypothetical protein
MSIKHARQQMACTEQSKDWSGFLLSWVVIITSQDVGYVMLKQANFLFLIEML